MPKNVGFIECPHCGYEEADCEGIFDDNVVDQEVEIECNDCGKMFFVSREIDITYYTKKGE